jgi:hypothetical protein
VNHEPRALPVRFLKLCLDVLANLCGKALHHPLIRGSRIFQPEGYCSIAERTIRGYEFYFDFILFFQVDLIITRICIQEGKTFTTFRGVDNLIDLWEGEVILRAVFIETCEIDAHANDFSVFLQDEHWVGDPSGLGFYFIDETNFFKSMNF